MHSGFSGGDFHLDSADALKLAQFPALSALTVQQQQAALFHQQLNLQQAMSGLLQG